MKFALRRHLIKYSARSARNGIPVVLSNAGEIIAARRFGAAIPSYTAARLTAASRVGNLDGRDSRVPRLTKTMTTTTRRQTRDKCL
jgi:hypothetical protein